MKVKAKICFFEKIWDYNEFFPIIKTMFNNIEVNIPHNPDYFLTMNYGADYMTVLKSSCFIHKTETKIKTDKTLLKHFLILLIIIF